MSRSDAGAALLIALVMFVAYNTNGREVATYDSQPTKLAARELLLRGSLSVGHVVGRTPALIERSGFQMALDGRYRSAYSPVPAIAAAGIVWPLWKTGVIDLQAPLAPALISALSSSLLVALAVALSYLTARRYVGVRRAVLLSAAFGLGTGLWSTASQTLWQHETSIFGLALSVWALTGLARARGISPAGGIPERTLVGLSLAVGVGLGLAAGSRLQLAPVVTVIVAATVACGGWRAAFIAGAGVTLLLVPVLNVNVRWFGSVLGAAPMLEALHDTIHATSGSFGVRSDGFLGLLISPSRGLLIFSPIVAIAALGLPRMLELGWRSPVLWCVAAAFAQFLLYGSYSVWWGGHTYGPRYMLDVLPLLVPLAAAGAARVNGRTSIAFASALLAWSIAVSALGAFGYPHERWNVEPTDVDRNHARLWDWSDPQIARVWKAGASPQNFRLFTRDAFRAPEDR